MKTKITIFLWLMTLLGCLETLPLTEETVSKEEYDRVTQTLLLGIEGLKRQKDNDVAAAYGSLFELRGAWNSFTGNGTTLDTIVRYPSGAQESIHTDATTYSSCEVLISYTNSGMFITQNPQNNGICPNGFTDNNKGKFNKVVYFRDGSKIWICSVVTTRDTYEEALNAADTSNRSNPGSSGCGGFAWSRIEKR